MVGGREWYGESVSKKQKRTEKRSWRKTVGTRKQRRAVRKHHAKKTKY